MKNYNVALERVAPTGFTPALKLNYYYVKSDIIVTPVAPSRLKPGTRSYA